MKNTLLLLSFLTIAFLCGFQNETRASHITGGDFQYTCIGVDSFLIRLNIFRDCTGIPAPTAPTATFSSTCGGNFTTTLTLTNPGGTEVSQLCPTALNNSSCNGGSLPGMEHYIYEAIVVLSPTCNTWTMSWSDCCRNSPTNASSVGTYISAGLNSATDDCNNSPQFTAQPIPYVCQNQVVNYNFGVIEADGDSLVYSMVTGLSAATTPIPYTGGYNFAQPFGTTVPITLNAATGQLTFTPPSTGLYVVVVRVDEYDPVTGDHLGYVFRDIQIVVQPCSNLVPVVQSPGITNFTGTGAQLDSNSLEACIGQSLNFDIIFNDPDTSSPGDSITLFTNALQALDSSAIITITNGNPAIINVDWVAQPGNGNFVAFNVTAVDDACNVSGLINAAFDITILPSTYAGEDQTICQGTQSATLIATGGSSFTWSVITGDPISVGVNFTCDTCDTTVATPSITTTYEVVSNLSSTCSNRDTVTVFVVPNFDLTLPDDTLICFISDFPLFANTNQPGFNYTYQWSPATGLSDDTIANPIANPSEPTTYSVTVTSAGGCIKTDNVTLDLSPPFPANIEVLGDTVLCIGDTVHLNVDLGDVSPVNCGLSTSACLGVTNSGDVGTGTNTNTGTSYPAIYGNFYWGARHQILYTPADLAAAGMTSGGKISSLAFDVATVGAQTFFSDFTIKMGCTNSSDLTGGWETGLVTVVAPYTHTVTAGWNTHTFSAPYDWDGTSNLVVEVCFNNSAWISNGNSQQRYTSTLGQSVRYYRADQSGVCGNTGLTATSNERPNTRFNYCSGADPNAFTFDWINATVSNTTIPNPNAVPNAPTTYSVVVADTFGGCTDTIDLFVDVVTQFNAFFDFNDPLCISALPDTATPAVGGGVWTGVGITDGIAGVFDPAQAGVGLHPVTYTIAGNCANDTTINVEVISLPDASIIAPDEYCISGAPLNLGAATSGGVFSGPGTNGNDFDPSGLTPGIYDIIYSLTVPCPNTDTHSIKVINPYNFTFDNDPVSVCDNDTLILGNNYTLITGTLYGNGPVLIDFQGTGITDTALGHFNGNGLTPGDYLIDVSVSDTFGNCGTTNTMTVKVLATEYAELLKDEYCDSETNQFLQIDKPSATWVNFPTDATNDTLKLDNFNQFSPQDLGDGKWVFNFSYTNANNCLGESVDTLYINHTPADPEPFSDDFCQNDSVIVETLAENPDSLIWEFRESGDTTYLGSGSPNSGFGLAPDPATGPYSVFVKEVNGFCESEYIEYILPIRPAPTAEYVVDYEDLEGVNQFNINVGPTDTIRVYQPASIWVRAQGFGANDSLVWDLNDGDLSGNGDVIFNAEGDVPALPQDFRSPGLYRMLLTHYNQYGCLDETWAYLEVIGREQVPNVFTPNGDGINDLFYVIAPVRDFSVEIYNRWGRKIYEYDCNQCSQRDKGWDGGDHPDGTYFFVVSGSFNDGSSYTQKGTVTLTGGN